MPELPPGMCLRFLTDIGVIGIALPLSQAFTCLDEAFTCINRFRSRDRNALLKRPYDGCGAGAGALLRAPVWRVQVSGVGGEMTCRVHYVVADAVLLQIGRRQVFPNGQPGRKGSEPRVSTAQ